MKAFITGITGFAGGFLAEHLLASQDQVQGCSTRGLWRDDSLPMLRGMTNLAWDISGPAPNEFIAQVDDYDPEVIYHLASISVPAECGTTQPTPRALGANTDGTAHVLQLAAKLKRPPRVIFISSCYVYAPVTSDAPVVDENFRVDPATAYGKTKLAAEDFCQKAIREDKVDVIIARSFQHTGPRQNPRMMLPQWCQQLIGLAPGEPLVIRRKNSNLDLSDARDVVRAYRLLALHGKTGENYNVGTGKIHNSGEIARQLLQAAGEAREIVETNPAHEQQPIADTTRIFDLTGWRAEIPLARTMLDTLEWWRNRGQNG